MRSIDLIAAEYRAATTSGDEVHARLLLQEEAAALLLDLLSCLSKSDESFVQTAALKGGALMMSEFHSPRFSADLDFTRGHQATLDPDDVADDVERCGRSFGLRILEAERNKYGIVLSMTYQSRCTGGRQPSKVEISLREDPVFPIREVVVGESLWGTPSFVINALDPHDLIAEKIRTLFQRAQPRDLFDVWFYLTRTEIHVVPSRFQHALDAKFSITRLRKYREGAWRQHLDEIEAEWERQLSGAVAPAVLPNFYEVSSAVEANLRRLGIR